MKISYTQNTKDALSWFWPSFVHVTDCYDCLTNNCKQIHTSKIKKLLFFVLYKRMDIGSQNICWIRYIYLILELLCKISINLFINENSLYVKHFQYLRYCTLVVLEFFALINLQITMQWQLMHSLRQE